MSIHDLPVKLAEHLFFTLASVAIGFALGVVLGVLLSRRPRLSGVVLPILSIFNTIPGIVFIGLLFLAFIIALIGYHPDTRISLYVGMAWIALLLLGWVFKTRRERRLAQAQ